MIDGLLIHNGEFESKILCKGEMLKDEFITDRIVASFGEKYFTEVKGEPEIFSTPSVLNDDQFILVISNK